MGNTTSKDTTKHAFGVVGGLVHHRLLGSAHVERLEDKTQRKRATFALYDFLEISWGHVTFKGPPMNPKRINLFVCFKEFA